MGSALEARTHHNPPLNGYVWFDQDLSGGQAKLDKILARIRESDLFVFVLRSASLLFDCLSERVWLCGGAETSHLARTCV